MEKSNADKLFAIAKYWQYLNGPVGGYEAIISRAEAIKAETIKGANMKKQISVQASVNGGGDFFPYGHQITPRVDRLMTNLVTLLTCRDRQGMAVLLLAPKGIQEPGSFLPPGWSLQGVAQGPNLYGRHVPRSGNCAVILQHQKGN